MKRRVVALAIVVAVAAIGVWFARCGGGDVAGTSPGEHARSATTAMLRAASSDPRALARASIRGTVTDDAHAPIAGVRVCADAWTDALPTAITHDPLCTETDARGRYALLGLVPAPQWTVAAGARGYRPAPYHAPGDFDDGSFALVAGEAKTGVDIVLRKGGAEVTGTVVDLTARPLAGAQVRAWGENPRFAGAMVETDAAGRFSLWVDDGDVTVAAEANGYAASTVDTHVPATLHIVLGSESAVAGTVVDALTNRPVAGARVTVTSEESYWSSDDFDITGEDGAFHIGRLTPFRYVVIARTAHGYGRSTSRAVGLGEHVAGVVVRLVPAHRVEGTVRVAGDTRPCPDATVVLQDRERRLSTHAIRDPDGRLHADGVLPGTYTVDVACPGHATRTSYDQITITDRDVEGVVWEVDRGATIRGRVVTSDGAPIAGAKIRTHADDEQDIADRVCAADGRFEVAGLRAGVYRIVAAGPHDVEASIDVTLAAGATVERDVTLAAGGTLSGTVVDDDGQPFRGAYVAVRLQPVTRDSPEELCATDAAGAFVCPPLAAGDDGVGAFVFTRQDAFLKVAFGTRVTIRAAQTSTVRLTLARLRGTIRGTVVDSGGTPLAGVHVAARSIDWDPTSELWDDGNMVTTARDGTFVVTGLAEGSYDVHALRDGGGEAITEHVALGTTTTVRFQPTASFEGTARRAGGPPVDELVVVVMTDDNSLVRRERFLLTQGHFRVDGLPAGRYKLSIEAAGSQTARAVELHDGEARTGIDVALEPLVTVTGRLVDKKTRAPLVGIAVAAMRIGDGIFDDDATPATTDAAGRFTLANVAHGTVLLRYEAEPGSVSGRHIEVTGSGTVDVGDVAIPRFDDEDEDD